MSDQQQWDYRQSVFLDDSALHAYMDPEHRHYEKARNFFAELDDMDRTFVSTSYIIFDTHQWLRDRYGYKHAEFFLEVIEKACNKNKLLIIASNSDLENEAKKLLMQAPQCQFSLGEAVSAVIMITYGISRIFTFNKTFQGLAHLGEGLKPIPTAL